MTGRSFRRDPLHARYDHRDTDSQSWAHECALASAAVRFDDVVPSAGDDARYVGPIPEFG